MWDLGPADREPVFAALRAHRVPRFFDHPEKPQWGLPHGPGFYALVRHADVAEASRRPADFCSGYGTTSTMDLPVEFSEGFGSMMNMDGDRHARLRRIVVRAFAPKMLARTSEIIDKVAASLVDGALRRGEGDFVTEIAAQLPLQVICAMAGVPRSEHEFVLSRSNRILGAFDPEYAGDHPDLATNILSAGNDLIALVEDLAEQRLGEPRDDLVTALVHANVDGEKLTRAEIASFFILLLVAGNETTRHSITTGFLLLHENPDQRVKLAGSFDTHAMTATEEIVRHSSATNWMRRTVTRDCELIGHHFSEGDRVLLFYWSANRDETVFTDPLRFDVTRDPNPHVGFGGGGPHHCLGAHLARLEIVAILRELLFRAPGIAPSGRPDWLRSSFINGIKHLDYRASRAAVPG